MTKSEIVDTIIKVRVVPTRFISPHPESLTFSHSLPAPTLLLALIIHSPFPSSCDQHNSEYAEKPRRDTLVGRVNAWVKKVCQMTAETQGGPSQDIRFTLIDGGKVNSPPQDSSVRKLGPGNSEGEGKAKKARTEEDAPRYTFGGAGSDVGLGGANP